MSKQVEAGVRAAVIRELKAIRGIDTFLARTAADRPLLDREVARLRDEVQKLQSQAKPLSPAARANPDHDTCAIDQACLEIACAILCKRPRRVIAGPLLLWDDGVLYAITSRGGNPIPSGSSPLTLIEALVFMGHPVVQVRETTIIGGWTRGPIYRKGSATINGWATVWTDEERVARTFEGVQLGDAERVHEILRQLRASDVH